MCEMNVLRERDGLVFIVEVVRDNYAADTCIRREAIEIEAATKSFKIRKV